MIRAKMAKFQFVLNFIIILFANIIVFFAHYINNDNYIRSLYMFLMLYMLLTLILQLKGYWYDYRIEKTKIGYIIVILLIFLYLLYTFNKISDYAFNQIFMLALFIINIGGYKKYKQSIIENKIQQ